jgi:hypothetical protein
MAIDKAYLNELNLERLSNNGFFKIGYRKNSFLKSNMVLGRERKIIFPNEDAHNGIFAVVELDEILASHNEVSFVNTEGYPTDETGRSVNDRNYSGDKNAQAKVVSVAQRLMPEIIISTSATASGTPIITVDGIVVSGNNRTMSLKLASKSYTNEYSAYVKELYSEIERGGYGFNMAQIYEAFNKPVLVRFDVDFPEYTTAELNAFNKSRSKSEKAIDIAIRLSRQLNDNANCQEQLINLVSEQEVVSEIYNDREALSRLKKILLNCKIITQNDLSGLFSGNTLTETGKILYETLLLSIVLESNAIEISQNNGVKSATRSIVNAIIPLVKNKRLADGVLIKDVNVALLIQNDMVSRGYDDLTKYIGQQTLFENEIFKITPKSIVLNWYMNQGVNLLKNTLIKYNNSVESNTSESIFGDNLSPEQIFKEFFEHGADKNLISLVSNLKDKEQKQDVLDDKSKITNRISSLEKAKKYQSESEIFDIEKIINNLKTALKYL